MNERTWTLRGENQSLRLAAGLAPLLRAGDVVLLSGELGAGKTTFVRGLLLALRQVGPVRSPTFNIIQTFETDPPVMHADLYRLKTALGLGLEDYLDTHLCLIEWPDRLGDWIDIESCFHLHLGFVPEGRVATFWSPAGRDVPDVALD